MGDLAEKASGVLLAAIFLLVTMGLGHRIYLRKGIGARFTHFMLGMLAVLCTTLLTLEGELPWKAAAVILAGAAGISVFRWWGQEE